MSTMTLILTYHCVLSVLIAAGVVGVVLHPPRSETLGEIAHLGLIGLFLWPVVLLLYLYEIYRDLYRARRACRARRREDETITQKQGLPNAAQNNQSA